jgi:hypothetical protein
MSVRQALRPEQPLDAVFDPVQALAACRASGVAESDPVGFCVTETMARRAATLHGTARALLMQRIEQRLARHLTARQDSAERVTDPALAAPAPNRGLRLLVERLDRFPAADPGVDVATPSPRPLNALTAHKGTWSRLRAEQRLRQALAQVPSMAGPLNSSQVVHRALQTLHDLSPAYLDAFMAHIDTLLWLEQASGGDVPLKSTGRPKAGPRR